MLIASHALERLGYRNYSALVRNGDIGARSIAHTHIHVVPAVQLGDLTHAGQERAVMNAEEVSSLKEELTYKG